MILTVRDLYTSYGLSQILFGVSLEVNAGECVALLGRNGVGKTTTLRSIMGLTPPRQGQVWYKDRDITGLPAYRVAKLGLGFVPEDSGGEQQMLTIGRTLMGNPDLLLLDEPSEGLAPLVVRDLGRQIQRLKEEGLTILLCEQNTKFATALSDRAYVLEKGQVRFAGTIAALQDNEAVRRQYLAL